MSAYSKSGFSPNLSASRSTTTTVLSRQQFIEELYDVFDINTKTFLAAKRDTTIHMMTRL